MPNWCSTTITINHSSEEKLNKLECLINQWISKDYMSNSFGHTWLGNIVLGSGIGTVDTGKETDLRCRGSITYMQNCGDCLRIDTETAWAPMMKMWQKLLDKYLPDAELIYSSEEPGCEVYYTNDPVYEGLYVIDSWNDEIESDWEADENTVRETLQKLLKTKERDIRSLISLLYDSEDEMVSVHKWRTVEICDLD